MLLSLYQVQNSHILLLHNYYRKKKKIQIMSLKTTLRRIQKLVERLR